MDTLKYIIIELQHSPLLLSQLHHPHYARSFKTTGNDQESDRRWNQPIWEFSLRRCCAPTWGWNERRVGHKKGPWWVARLLNCDRLSYSCGWVLSKSRDHLTWFANDFRGRLCFSFCFLWLRRARRWGGSRPPFEHSARFHCGVIFGIE